MNSKFWRGKSVFITGHTGFKGSWLSLWLHSMGADVTGFALEPPTNPNAYELFGLASKIKSVIGDIRDLPALSAALNNASPQIVFHLAAQPLVRDSYRLPLDTYSVNVMGTCNLLEAVRRFSGEHKDLLRAFVNVTTDKVYDNKEWTWGYRENDRLGGFDPYSNSKACSEMVTAAYRSSFFPEASFEQHRLAIATARAGNVIGGGDWAADRLIPDCLRSLLAGSSILLRSPQAVRPWQHVLEPLSGYLLLAEKLFASGFEFADAWNFGPADTDVVDVETVVRQFCVRWGSNNGYSVDKKVHPHEAGLLKLDCSKSIALLGWRQRWDLHRAIDATVEWTKAYVEGAPLADLSLRQIDSYINS